MPDKNVPVDVVLVASRKADGSPDQTPGFKYLDEEAGKEATKRQLAEQAASAADVAVRLGEMEGSSDEEETPDPLAEQREEIIRKAYEEGEARGESEFEGNVGANPVEPIYLDEPAGTNHDEGGDEE